MADYTLEQAELFLTAIGKAEMRSERSALLIARGAQSKPEHFKKLLRELEK